MTHHPQRPPGTRLPAQPTPGPAAPTAPDDRAVGPAGASVERARRPRPGPGRAGQTSPLASLGRAFDVLVAPPAPYALELPADAVLAGSPRTPVPAARLRGLLLSRQTGPSTRDAIWRELVRRARRPAPEGQAWTVIAAGAALPGLIAAAGTLCRGWQGDTADVDAEVLAGFVARLGTVDLSGPRVLGRLIDAAIRAGRRARAQACAQDTVPVDEAWSCPPGQPWGHPDWVLVSAVEAGVLDVTEARLIGATRLESWTLAEVAGALGIDPDLAAGWRRRAEARLARALAAGEVDTARSPTPGPARGRGHAARLSTVKAQRRRRRSPAAASPSPSRSAAAG